MYNQSYEEYMRSILGYPNQSYYDTYNTNDNYEFRMVNDNEDLEEYYPEIYRIVYPMVCRACDKNTQPVTRQLIESMTNEIYMSIEGNQEVNLNINLTNDVRSSNKTDSSKKQEAKVENRSGGETRQLGTNNFMLNDLIRILLIRELLRRRRQNFPQRPLMGPGRLPMRPNFPGGMGPGRPPMMPRDFDNNYDNYNYNIYEY